MCYMERNISLWASNNTRLLLTIYKEKENNLKKRQLKQGQFWETIAKEINRINPKIRKTVIQCSNKIAYLKHTYKNIKDHNNKFGNNRKNWSFYEDMDRNRILIFLAIEHGSLQNLASKADRSQFSPF